MRVRTKLVVLMAFDQECKDGEQARPDEYIEKEIEETFGCKAIIMERTDKEIE